MTRPVNPYLDFPAPLVIAHRGGAGVAPENTLPAFDHAASLTGVNALETDIHMTKDGVIVAAHDPDIDAHSDGSGMVRHLTYAELLRADMGYNWSTDDLDFPYRGRNLDVPTLGHLFERYPDHIINIDIKQHEPVVVERFVRLIQEYEVQDRIVVGSFDTHTIRRFRKLMPFVATCATYGEVVSFLLLSLANMPSLWRHGCVALQIPERQGSLQVVTPDFVRKLHQQGVQVHVWTVNDSADMARLLSWGVDGIITDYPQRAIDVIAQNA